MNRRDEQIIKKILAEIQIVGELLQGFSEKQFMEDERTARAVCMTLINIGELIKNVTPELRERYREIPWRAVAGMRDVTAHKYQTLHKDDVFHTCAEDIPKLREQLAHILEMERHT